MNSSLYVLDVMSTSGTRGSFDEQEGQALKNAPGTPTDGFVASLNGIDVVRNTTRTRVVKALSELKYQPNLHARSLAGGRSRTIGVIVPNLANPFFLDVIRTIESDCHTRGYEILFSNSAYRSQQLVANVQMMIGRRVAGLAVIGSEMEEALVQELTESSIPIVFYDVGEAGGNCTKIRVNYRKGIERVVEYLAALGHEQLSFIGHHAVLESNDERRQAFLDTVARVYPKANVRVAADSDSLEGRRQAVRELLSYGPRPTAIICVNDFMALGALKELQERRIRVPEDMSVTGF